MHVLTLMHSILQLSSWLFCNFHYIQWRKSSKEDNDSMETWHVRGKWTTPPEDYKDDEDATKNNSDPWTYFDTSGNSYSRPFPLKGAFTQNFRENSAKDREKRDKLVVEYTSYSPPFPLKGVFTQNFRENSAKDREKRDKLMVEYTSNPLSSIKGL